MCKRHGFSVLGLLVFVACSASAQTWNGGGADNNWSTAGNWIGGVVPANPSPAAGTANIIFDLNTRLTPNIDAAWNINSLAFNGTAGSFTLGGMPLALEAGITNNSANTQTINSSLTLGIASGFQTFTTAAGGNLNIGGSMDWFGSALTVDGAGNTTFSGVGTDSGPGASLVKNGTGTLTLSNSNGYTSGTTINAGTVIVAADNALSSAGFGTTVNTGGTLAFQGGITYTTLEPVTINGAGAAGRAGAVDNVSGINAFPGAITLGSASTIGSSAGALTLSGNVVNSGFLLTMGGAGNTTLSGVMSGTGGLTKMGAGTVQLSGAAANTYTGATTVNDGTLQFNKTAGVNAIAGTLTIGDGVGAANTDVIQFLASNQIPNATTPSIRSDGLLNLNGFNQTVGGLNITGGNVTTGAGTLTLGGNVTGNASASTATIAGNVALNGNYTFTIASGTAIPDMLVSANISGPGGARRLTKAGAGALTLSGVNTFTGGTTLNTGTLNINSTTALGGAVGRFTIAAGATIDNTSGVAITLANNNPQTWNGSYTFTGSNALNMGTGAVTLGASPTITVNASTLTEGGRISGAFGLTKAGAGTLTLSGAAANTFTGATTINAGTLNLAAAGALGSTSSVILNSGGTLLLSGASSGRINPAAGIAMAGGTLSANDATDTFGVMTLTANSVINLVSGAPSATLTFANTTWVPGVNTLSIDNWTGSPGVTGMDDRILFNSSMGGTRLSGIQFFSNNGVTPIGSGAYVLGGGEVVPAPEPGTILSGVLLLVSLAARRLRRQHPARMAGRIFPAFSF